MPTGLNNFAINDSARDVLTLGYNGGNSYFQGCNVGIGTTSPGARLDVNVGVAKTDTTAFGYPSLILRSNESSNFSNLGINFIGGASQAHRGFQFQTGESGITNSGNILFQPYGGNVGIGTTSPNAKLNVVSSGTKSTISIGNTAASTYSQLLMYGGASRYNWSIGAQYNVTDGLEITPSTATEGTTFSTPAVTILQTGRVGIGTTTPSQRLHVASSSSPRIQVEATTNSENAGIYFSTKNSSGTPQAGGVYYIPGTTPYLGFYGDNTNLSMVITSGGNVGIGTTDPTGKLDVRGGSIYFNRGTGNLGSNYIYINKGASNDGGLLFSRDNTLDWQMINSTTTGNFSLYSYGAGDTVFTIQRSNGNVGIGTTTPGNLLEVRSSTGGASVARFSDSTNADLLISFPLSGYSTFDSYVGGSGAGFTFRAATSELVRITSAGRVGIGGTSPAYLLDVFGPVASEAGEKDDITTRTKAGFWETSTATTGEGWPTTTNSYYHLISSTHLNTANYYSLQIAAPFFAQNFYIRTTGNVGTQAWSSITTGTGTTNYVTRWASSTTLGNSVIYDDGTNIGIGTATPGAKLDVNGRIRIGSNAQTEIYSSSNRVVFRGENTDNVAQFAGYGLFLPIAGQSYNLYLAGSANFGYTDTTATLDIHRGNTGPFIRLNSNGTSYLNGGNVGIGTTSPSYTLDVNGIIGLSGFSFADKNSNYIRMYEPAGNVAMYLGNASDPGNYYDNTSHNFRNRGGSTFYMVINSSGDVGIGTTSPAYRLHIERADATDTRMLIRNTSTGNVGIELAGGGGNQYIDFTPVSSTDFEGRIIYSSSSDEMQFMTNITNRFKLNSNGAEVQNGALGVGVAASATDGRIDASNDIVSFSSDKRLKTNIQLIENPLDKIGKLSGFTYNWNDKAAKLANYDTNESLIGVFAQEVQAVLPEAVKLAPFDNDGNNKSISGENYLTVQYEKIVPLLIEAIKEQQKQIDDLKYLLSQK